jgi:hypothetical protein
MALAVLIHIVVSTFAAMALGLSAGRINTFIALASLATGAIAGIWTWRRSRNEDRLFPDIKFIPGILYGFIIFAGLQHFLYLLYYDQNGLRTLHLNNFGDLSMHIQYIRFLASAHFWPADPEFAGSLFRYPIGMDLYNALWEAVGVPIDSNLFLTGLILTIVTVSLLHRWSGWLGVGAFFLNAGLANWKAVFSGRLFDFQNGAAWKNFFLSLWITQRGFLFALPAGVYVIKMITEALIGERSLSKQEKIICAVLWSGLAWFHLHTFFIISIALGICIILHKKIREMIWIVVPAALIGLIAVFVSTQGFSQARIVHIRWDWVSEENFLTFWIKNLGPWILLGAVSLFFVFKKSYSRFRIMTAVFFGLFIVFTFVMVAPWDWDNVKVLLWLYLLIVWLAWKTWASRLSPAFAILAGCILFIPGAVSITSSLPGKSVGVQIYQASELWEAKAAFMDLPVDAVLAAVPDPDHPAAFWGAKVAMGYTGHLWSHGIDYLEREEKLDRVFKGQENWLDLAKSIGVTHIYWGENEKRKYGAFNPSWLGHLKNISRSSKIGVYELPR